MATGKQGSALVTISIEDSPGGSAQVITGGVLEMSGAKIIQGREDGTAFGDAWKAMVATGVGEVPDITLSGFFDTTATTGEHVVLGTPDSDPNGGTRELILGFGDSKTFTVEVNVFEYEAAAAPPNLTRFTALLVASGAPAWA